MTDASSRNLPDTVAHKIARPADRAPTEPGDAPLLVVLRSGKEIARLRLDRSPLRVGRLPDNELVLDDRLVSRHHATLVHEGGQWWIRDAGSRSKLRVARQVCDAHAFADGDRVGVGPFTLVFLQSSRSQAAVAGREVSPPPREPGAGDGLDAREELAAAPIEIPGYEIAREIGRGGMGRVYEATQLSTRRKVALKVLLEGPFSSEKSKHRFEREVRIVAGLRHPNIAQVYESGLHQGRYWFSMEYVEGRPLNQAAEAEKLTLGQRLAIMAQACEAVGYAHEHKVIHRDLKPGNILLSADGQPHVLDFGLAKLEEAGPAHEVTLSVAGTLMGTPAYMSPEQTARDPSQVDARTDVYSLGVVLYHLVTGQFPYDVRGRIDEVIRNIATAEPTPPSRLVRAIDNELEAIILKALAKEREERYSTAAEFAADLRRRIKGEPVEAKLASRTYRFKKSLVRYRLHMVGAGVLAAAIVVSALVTRSMLSREHADDSRKAAGMTTQPAGADWSSLPKAAERQATTGGDEMADGSAAPPATIETAETDAKTLVYQVEGALQVKNWPAALGYLEKLRTGYAATAVVRELGEKPATWERQIREGFQAAVAEEATAPVKPAEAAETNAEALVQQLEGAIRAGSWQAARDHLERLKLEHADTSTVRALGDRLAAWEQQIRDGLDTATAAANEREARDRLKKLETLLDRDDYLRAHLVLDRLQERFGQTYVVQQADKKLAGYAARIDAKIKQRNVQAKNQYLLYANPPGSTQWQKAMQDARLIASQNKLVKRLFLARVVLEDEETEPAFGVEGHGVATVTSGGGYTDSISAKSGGIIIATPDLYARGGGTEEFGLVINTLYHDSPTITLDYDEKQVTKVEGVQVVRLGEFVVHSISPEDTGTLVVTIVPEIGFRAEGTKVNVWRGRGNYPNFPVAADNRCVVHGIAAGEYQLGCSGAVCSAGTAKAIVRPGETTEVTLSAYGQRAIEVDWRVRSTPDTPGWRSGKSRLVTGAIWQCHEEWGVEYVSFQVSPWDGEKCGLWSNSARILRLDGYDFAAQASLPADDQFPRSSPDGAARLEVGAVYAIRPNNGSWQALIRVAAITPVPPSAQAAPDSAETQSDVPAPAKDKDSKSKKGTPPRSEPKRKKT